MTDTVSRVKNNRVETGIYTQRYSETYDEWHIYSCWKTRDESEHGMSVDLARRYHEALVKREPTKPGFVDGKVREIPVRYRFVVIDHDITETVVTRIEEG